MLLAPEGAGVARLDLNGERAEATATMIRADGGAAIALARAAVLAD